MGVGQKIKEFRTKKNLTQKDLADELHVTYQAVSRWENDDAEPSIDTLKAMSAIFGCSTDELLGVESKKEEKKEEEVKVVEKVIVQQTKPVLDVCEKCNKPIYEPVHIHRIEEPYTVRSGRSHHTEYKRYVLCSSCYANYLEQKRREKEAEEKERLRKLRSRRTNSFVWPTLLALVFVFLAIMSFAKTETNTGFIYLGVALLSYTFLATVILNNTFITEMWLEISSWGFITLPGVIFNFSLNGLIFLIVIKILFFLIGIGVAVLAISFATALAMALSLFVYPFALSKNLKEES